MSPRAKTVADAIELFEGLSKDLQEYKGDFKDHVKEQRAFNLEITARVVEGEKASIGISSKLDTILERMNRNAIGWQVWASVGLTLLMSIISVVIQIWPKGI